MPDAGHIKRGGTGLGCRPPAALKEAAPAMDAASENQKQ